MRFGSLPPGSDVIVHEYFGVDLEVVWRVIEVDLPALKQRVKEILAAEGYVPLD
jgi:uncharacterized protein with HEPN domain